MVVKKPKKIVLLKEKLDHIFRNFGSNFDSTGENFLINLAKDEKKIDYNNLIFNIDDNSVVESVDSLEEFGTLYDLLIYLLGNAERIIISSEDQMKFLKAITVLKKIISSMKIGMTDQSEEQNKKIFAEQESVLNNAEVFFKKRNDKINQFGKNSIISNGEKFFDAPKMTEKSTPEKSFFKPIEVSKDKLNSIKLKILRNKKLSTTIDNKQYTLSDVNDLVNKIDSKSISKDEIINIYNDIVEKGKKLAGSRQTPNRQNFSDIINSLKEIFNELPDTTDMPDLESEERRKKKTKKKTKRERFKNTNPKTNA